MTRAMCGNMSKNIDGPNIDRQIMGRYFSGPIKRRIMRIIDDASPKTPALPPDYLSYLKMVCTSICPLMLSKYKLQYEIGSGAFGLVISAIRTSDKRTVAIKLMLKNKIPPSALVMDEKYGLCPREIHVVQQVRIC
jgi:serine/threonine protein kinase